MVVPDVFEQDKILKLTTASAKQIQDEQARLAKLQALKRGLMEDLLTGRVRVAVADASITKTEEVHV